MDVKSAFLNATIKEEVYVEQPPGFEDSEYTNHVYKLSNALYGLKQAPRAWYECLRDFLITNGFKVGKHGMNALEISLSLMDSKSERLILLYLLKLLKMTCLYAKFMLMILYLGLLTSLHVKNLAGS